MGGKGSKKKAASPKYKKEMKMVVLGIAASGKSTFIRQMRLIHQSCWTQSELENFYDIICHNIYDGMKEVCVGMNKLGIEFEDKENAKRARYFKELIEMPAIDEKELERIKGLWADKNVQKCAEQLKTSADLIVHNLAYFVERLDVIAGENYIPSDTDILHSRQRSTGGQETSFVKDKTKITLVDMGGQKPERAKWDRALSEGVKGIFYFVSIEEFNVPSAEEKGKTKFEVSIETWKELLANPKLAKVSIILLFNKMDLFEEKLKNFSCILDQFPDYDGPKTKEGALEFLRAKFVDEVPETYNLDFISSFTCCALDTELMGKLFIEAKLHMLQRSLMANGF